MINLTSFALLISFSLLLGFDICCCFTLCSIKVFTIASVICLALVLPLNYFGKEMEHKNITDELLSVFTIGNVQKGSQW